MEIQYGSPWFLVFNSLWEVTLLTEAQVERSFRRMFNGGPTDPEVFEKAEELLDELRPESPLRHRLWCELEELREVATAQQ